MGTGFPFGEEGGFGVHLAPLGLVEPARAPPSGAPLLGLLFEELCWFYHSLEPFIALSYLPKRIPCYVSPECLLIREGWI